MSRAGDAIALALSAALHAAFFGAALLVVWEDDIRPATILLVDLIGHAPEPRPVDQPRPAPPRPTPVPPVARQIRPPEDVPAPPRPEAPPEMREPRAAPAPRPPEQPALEAVPSDAAPATQSSGASRASDTDAAAAGVAVPSASGEPPITARAPAAPGTTSGPSVAAVPAPAAPEQITQTARRRGGYQVPAYPMAARQVGAEGTTLLRVHVSTDGSVDEVQVQRSAGHPALDRAATEAVRKWRFEPARNGSVAVAVWVVVPFEFRLKKDF